MPHTHTNVSEESRSKRIDIVLWIVAWLLHLPKPVLIILNESRGPLLGILYRFDNLLLPLDLLHLISCLLMAFNLYRGLARVGVAPFRQPLFWLFPCAIFILPVFSAFGAMLWLRGKKIAVAGAHKKLGVSLHAVGIFLVIIGGLFWITFTDFKGYVLRSVITEKVLNADQSVQVAAGFLKAHDLKQARREVNRGRELLRQVAFYHYPYRQEEMKRIELALDELENAALMQEQKRLK